MKFENKIALVTGGSSGIGRAACLALAREGAAVAVIASSSLAKASAVVQAIEKDGGKANAYVTDIRNVAASAKLIDQVVADLGEIDILVNCAGVFYPTILGSTSEEEFDRMSEINLKGLYFVTNAVAPRMRKRGRGKIVNIASVAAYVVSRDYGLYAAVKAGIVALTKAFALQLAPHGINVNAVAPGNTETPINEDIRNDPKYQKRRDMIASQTPSQRDFSTPEDIASIIVFLASDDSISMHGTTVLADEGRSAGT